MKIYPRFRDSGMFIRSRMSEHIISSFVFNRDITRTVHTKCMVYTFLWLSDARPFLSVIFFIFLRILETFLSRRLFSTTLSSGRRHFGWMYIWRAVDTTFLFISRKIPNRFIQYYVYYYILFIIIYYFGPYFNVLIRICHLLIEIQVHIVFL